IYYLVKKSKYLGKTKLIKLLYLADYEHYKYFDNEISDIEYIRWNFGPYSPEVCDCIDEMVAIKIITIQRGISVLKSRDYYSFNIIGKYNYTDDLKTEEIEFIKYILKKYDHLEIDELIKIAYATEPMTETSRRGEILDFRVREKVVARKLSIIRKELNAEMGLTKQYDPKDSLIDEELILHKTTPAS
ncbi:unnamed protein product, partial [marine sediment metagenome]